MLWAMMSHAHSYFADSIRNDGASKVIANHVRDEEASKVIADSLNVDTVDSLTTDSLAKESIQASTLTVQQRLNDLLNNEMFQKSTVAIMAYDLTADTLLYTHNERQLLRPASTQKLTTAITALDHLGGAYRYTTSMRYDGQCYANAKKRQNFVGDITIIGGMDPRFGTDDMNAFIESLQKEHIDTIFGNVRADLSFKDTNRLGSGWCWDDDNPILTALPWNRGDNFIPKFQQRIRDAGMVIMPYSAHNNTATSIDSISTDVPMTVEDTLAVSDLRSMAVSRHHTLDQILVRMLKDSDNLFAESMFYQIAAEEQKPATAKTAIYIINQLIKKVGLTPSDYRIADGSGLSLYNYQTVELQIHLLRYAFHNPNIYADLYHALPIAGVDGTLKNRMHSGKAYNNVHAKTGTVTGVSSLSGYLTAANGNTIAFAIINQGIRSSSPAKNFQDNACRIMCDYQ